MSASLEVPGCVAAGCRAVVIVPARDEEGGLISTLDRLRVQRGLDGALLAADAYEVLLLLNNCNDESEAVARRYAGDYPEFRLRVMVCALEGDEAHVGTARRLLMDAACERLEQVECRTACAILSTDADTLVAEDWIAANLAEIEAGAEVVGGVIHLHEEDLAALDEGVRVAYERDRRLQGLVARLEAWLAPDAADPWPRHLENFGASLACTPSAYRRCGGLPPVKPLEDVAFVEALRGVGARIRHSPKVQVWTSARLDGRAEVGLSGQLRLWEMESARGLPQMVDSAAWMEHRFRTLGGLKRLNAGECVEEMKLPAEWIGRVREGLRRRLATAQFLEEVDGEGLIRAMFGGLPGEPPRRQEIRSAMEDLEEMMRWARDARGDRAGSARLAGI